MQSEILELIGAIVLSTQDAERYMKVILPFTDSKDPSISGALDRHEKLIIRSFGQLIEKFKDSSTSDSKEFSIHLDKLVKQRNQVVHHFIDTYGRELGSGNSQDVLAALRIHLANANALRDVLEQTALSLFEVMGETTFLGTPEGAKVAELCKAVRQRLAR